MSKSREWIVAVGALFASLAVAGPLEPVRFDWFEYRGEDAVFSPALDPQRSYRNPILTGFHPDPSIVQVGADYYLVNSTFTYFPGIPVFHSRDLVNWTQIGNVIDRPSQLDFSGLGVSRGIFAPDISYHEGTYYLATTCVDCGGNFVVTAQHPAGPWSDPVWLEGMGGIDPSLFVDSDGRAYFVNNDEPPGEAAYDGHRALWVQEFDLASLRLIGPRRMIVNGGADFSQQPIWIEGPHFFRRDGQLYLIAAEGGTAEGHSQVVFKADSVFGPLEPYAGNPILTQRHLDPAREAPVTSVGHADFVQDAEGEWWSVFLGTRPYAGDFYNTGRETFLLPVRWEGGWPLITRGDERVPYQVERPALPPAAAPAIPTSGNFRLRDEFSGEGIAPYWLQLRTPGGRPWVDTRTEAGTLLLTPRAERLDGVGNPSFLARRQQHAHASASTRMRYHPRLPGERAGMAAFQNGAYYYFLGVERRSDGPLQLVVTRRAGDPERTLRRLDLDAPAAAPLDLRLRIRASAGVYDFDYALGEGPWQAALEGADGRLLSTRTAGGFVGTVFGLYAERPAAGEGEMPGAAAP